MNYLIIKYILNWKTNITNIYSFRRKRLLYKIDNILYMITKNKQTEGYLVWSIIFPKQILNILSY